MKPHLNRDAAGVADHELQIHDGCLARGEADASKDKTGLSPGAMEPPLPAGREAMIGPCSSLCQLSQHSRIRRVRGLLSSIGLLSFSLHRLWISIWISDLHSVLLRLRSRGRRAVLDALPTGEGITISQLLGLISRVARAESMNSMVTNGTLKSVLVAQPVGAQDTALRLRGPRLRQDRLRSPALRLGTDPALEAGARV